ncbi:MAG: hypothetical protein WCS31_01905 [Verrucomicrobiae bacterium]
MKTFLYYAGVTWLILLGALILVCSLAILFTQDIWKFWEIMSPFNLVNWLVIALMAAPGLLLVQYFRKP